MRVSLRSCLAIVASICLTLAAVSPAAVGPLPMIVTTLIWVSLPISAVIGVSGSGTRAAMARGYLAGSLGLLTIALLDDQLGKMLDSNARLPINKLLNATYPYGTREVPNQLYHDMAAGAIPGPRALRNRGSAPTMKWPFLVDYQRTGYLVLAAWSGIAGAVVAG